MRRLSVPVAVATAALFILPSLALVAPAAAEPQRLYTNTLFDTTFDLGIDVSGVPHNKTAVRSFILSLRPEWQPKVLAACAHFLEQPNSIQSPETYAFCANAFG